MSKDRCSAIVNPQCRGIWREWKRCVNKSIETFKADGNRKRSDVWAKKAAAYAWDLCVELTAVDGAEPREKRRAKP